MSHQQRPFEEWMRIVMDRICKPRAITRAQLAEEMGINVNTLSSAVFRGETGLELVERLARRAEVSAEELVEIEIGWLEKRASRRRDKSYRRAIEIIEALMGDLLDARAWMKKKGVLGEYQRSRRGRALARLMKDELARD